MPRLIQWEKAPSVLGSSRLPSWPVLPFLPQALPFSPVWLWFSPGFHHVLSSCPSPFPLWSALMSLYLSWCPSMCQACSCPFVCPTSCAYSPSLYFCPSPSLSNILSFPMISPVGCPLCCLLSSLWYSLPNTVPASVLFPRVFIPESLPNNLLKALIYNTL